MDRGSKVSAPAIHFLRENAALLPESARDPGQSLAVLACQQVGHDEEVKRELQVHQRANVAGDLCLTCGQGMPGFGVPQFHGEDGADSPAGEPEPAAGFSVGAGVQGEKQLRCPGHGPRGRRVPLRNSQRERVE